MYWKWVWRCRGCTDGGSKKVRGCTDSGSEKVGGCINGWFEEIESCTDARFEEIGDYTDRGNKDVEDCNDADTNKVMGWWLIYLHPPRDANRPQTGGNRATVNWVGGLPLPCYTYGIR